MDMRCVFSNDRRYRYELYRVWDLKKGVVNFIGLNPSTADERQNDNTIRKCIKFADTWGFGGMVMTNMFAFRATKPQAMLMEYDPIGPINDIAVFNVARASQMVIAAWGVHGEFGEREDRVLKLLRLVEVHCLGFTKNRHPRHPLYLRDDTLPMLLPKKVAA